LDLDNTRRKGSSNFTPFKSTYKLEEISGGRLLLSREYETFHPPCNSVIVSWKEQIKSGPTDSNKIANLVPTLRTEVRKKLSN